MFGDALLDILRASGVGPALRWVDDFVFFQILRIHVAEYNKIRAKWRTSIEQNGGRLQNGGRFWYKGERLPSDFVEEFVEDMSEPLKNLSAR